MGDFLFVWVEALCPSQQFFSHVGMLTSVELVLSNEDELSCSRTQHHAPVKALWGGGGRERANHTKPSFVKFKHTFF